MYTFRSTYVLTNLSGWVRNIPVGRAANNLYLYESVMDCVMSVQMFLRKYNLARVAAFSGWFRLK